MAGNLQFVEMSEDDHIFKNSSGNLTYNDNTIEEHEQPTDTLVLQCSNCNTVIGDTTAWGCADPILRTVGLKRMSFYEILTIKLNKFTEFLLNSICMTMFILWILLPSCVTHLPTLFDFMMDFSPRFL